MVIEPGNGYDGCFTAGFTSRAHTEWCCRETLPDTALARKNIIFNLVVTSDLLMLLDFGQKKQELNWIMWALDSHYLHLS